jgi:hypothetical protein
MPAATHSVCAPSDAIDSKRCIFSIVEMLCIFYPVTRTVQTTPLPYAVIMNPITSSSDPNPTRKTNENA